LLGVAAARAGARAPRLVCPQGAATASFAAGDYAVIHAAPNFTYKRWTREGWRTVAADLAARGLAVLATGGPAPAERAFLDDVWSGTPVRRVDGALTWPELATLLGQARIYVGPDTSMTHLAAASGCPTVALYGPTDPRLWGPVPAAGLERMWEAAGTIQRRGNVWLVQNPLPCLPCQNEGCERHLTSFSRCLDELTPAQVLRAVDEALPVAANAAMPVAAAAAGQQVARPGEGRYG
jgi:heptosyltransferase III